METHVKVLGALQIALERSASVSRPCWCSCSGRRRHRLSILNLAMIPFGTVVGVYGVWVLFSKETEGLFNGPAVAVQS